MTSRKGGAFDGEAPHHVDVLFPTGHRVEDRALPSLQRIGVSLSSPSNDVPGNLGREDAL